MQISFLKSLRFMAIVSIVVTLSNSLFGQKKPNIIIIWGDDIGQSNLSAYTFGMMGYRTPNIDRVVGCLYQPKPVYIIGR
jgi:hypothetical protein